MHIPFQITVFSCRFASFEHESEHGFRPGCAGSRTRLNCEVQGQQNRAEPTNSVWSRGLLRWTGIGKTYRYNDDVVQRFCSGWTWKGTRFGGFPFFMRLVHPWPISFAHILFPYAQRLKQAFIPRASVGPSALLPLSAFIVFSLTWIAQTHRKRQIHT